ncbi:MAG TPA: hypothetical protein VEB59_02160 [Gemmatimonadales bacterium]|nr:hypothetical protein [Gemmatimonadales bacterium]
MTTLRRGQSIGLLALGLLLGVAGTGLLLRGCDAEPLPAVARADTVYRRTLDTLIQVRKVTDSLILPADTVRDTVTFVRRDTVRLLVEAERAACDNTLAACERRVEERDQAIDSLRKVGDPLLVVYGGGGFRVPDGLVTSTTVEARTGAMLRLKRDLHVVVEASTRRELLVLVRKQVRLF